MPVLVIQQAGVEKVLRKLQPNKAASPYRLSPCFLKGVSKELSLSALYTRPIEKSFNAGYVPRAPSRREQSMTPPTIDGIPYIRYL